jgi:hypothetical protein
MATVISIEMQNYSMFDTVSIERIFITHFGRPLGNIHAHGSTDMATVSGILPTLGRVRIELTLGHLRHELTLGRLRCELTLGHLRYCQRGDTSDASLPWDTCAVRVGENKKS